MHFVSTRGHGPVDLATAIAQGPAPDGGLYLPAAWPRPAGTPRGPTFADTAAWLLGPLLDATGGGGAVEARLRAGLDLEMPLVELDADTHVLELFHGPTGAFKDVGARFLALALELVAPAEGARTVLVATSGDTGGAVARAFSQTSSERVVVLFPRDGVTAVQRRQFTTAGPAVTAVGVDGTFDACQELARRAFAHEELRTRHALTSANSLNVGRLLPQAAYYLHAALALPGVAPWWVVPSGNLGNLTAGVMAVGLGVPASGMLAALNRNDRFARWMRGESDGLVRKAVKTPSNAMDVADPSNLERLTALGVGGPRPPVAVVATRTEDQATHDAMRRAWSRWGYLADPHTAVGLDALAQARAGGRLEGPAVVLATAHPAKFADTVEAAVGVTPEPPASWAAWLEGPERWEEIPPRLDALAVLLEADRR